MLRLRTKKVNNRKGLSSGKPPLASLLTFFSKQRDASTVINKLDSSGDSDGSIVGRKYGSFNKIDNVIDFPKINSDYVKIVLRKTNKGSYNVILGNVITIGTTDISIGVYNERVWLGSDFVTNLAGRTGACVSGTDLITIEVFVVDNTATHRDDAFIVKCNGEIVGLPFDPPSAFVPMENSSIGGALMGTNPVFINGHDLYSVYCSYEGNPLLSCDFSSGLDGKIVNTAGVNLLYDISGDTSLFYGADLNIIPNTINNGFSVIDGVDGEVPPLLGTQVDAINGNPLTNPAIDNIVNIADGYIKLPTGVTIEVDNVSYDIFNKMSPIYNEDDGVTPNPTGSTYYLGDETTVYADEENYLWHINELNTETILSYLKPAYKFSWFVKNTFETGTYTPTSIKEILAYNAPITDESDLNKIKTYIGYDWEE